MKKVKHIVSFSGGKDSTCMLLKMIENNMQIDEIIFLDTGKEFESMYDHIKKVEKDIGRKITRLKSKECFEYYLYEHQVKKRITTWLKSKYNIKNKHELKKFLESCNYDELLIKLIKVSLENLYKEEKLIQNGYGWPSKGNRWCCQKFKKQQISSYVKKKYPSEDYKIIEYHGIAYDERNRSKKNKEKEIRYPLIEKWKITEKQALQYCYKRGYDWGGLYEIFDRVSCWCCPYKKINELMNLYIYYPDKWDKIKDMDKESFNEFKNKYSLQQLEERFNKEIKKEIEAVVKELRKVYIFNHEYWDDKLKEINENKDIQLKMKRINYNLDITVRKFNEDKRKIMYHLIEIILGQSNEFFNLLIKIYLLG
ncbi:phosphoadenosine phosphosulfate reductase family protein [Caldisalinibacter kiritimatiensis]|uniref:Phosphoadenosine phosphosulphate reductase domain-containing protein n=1 Tax=Caldisalinibacter kiritimatiensis TaxID=1304284 RepID=R1CPC1_9FIRM|nr:phosphoadenosine phosphosulfate reductase family protein [Caldisalinibacter kiritimatiensis]EOD00506.1 hypothetical protein L21TH_1440 [Caldisalinibacter kiritimatiensis]